METKIEETNPKPLNENIMNNEPPTRGNEVESVSDGTEINPPEPMGDHVNANAKRLEELAEKIRAAHQEEQKCNGMLEDWKKKRLYAGIAIGDYLLEAKSLVPPKQFIAWCRDEFHSKPSHRTLTRYMLLAKQKTHVTKVANGLRQGNLACADPERKRKSPQQSDFSQIKQHLSKAKNLLNNYPDLISCQEADLVCDLHDAIGIWATDYRSRTERHRLNKLRDAEFDVTLVEDKTKPVVQANAEVTLNE
jgi:hypothetical protein